MVINDDDVIDITIDSDVNKEKQEKCDVVECDIIEPIDNCDVITDIVFSNKEEVTLKDINYMCNYISEYEGCENCPLNSGKICGYAVLLRKFKDYQSINSIIKNWIFDNPPTSFLMDIKVKMPTVELDPKFKIPNFCVKSIYGKDSIECNCNQFDKCNMLCRKCWRTPMDPITREQYKI